ncbi:MAG: coproporphyrinogen dehydrogenase HemZ, partial [Dorea sp.]|nr:coproporphyrinogen dehydrogenase HemZ [Dorea sp.]
MITVRCREEKYTYNAYHMVKAFYPQSEVTSEVKSNKDDLERRSEGPSFDVLSSEVQTEQAKVQNSEQQIPYVEVLEVTEAENTAETEALMSDTQGPVTNFRVICRIFDDDVADLPHKEHKHAIDHRLYKALKEDSGRELAWGILLGVRPTKIAMSALESGMTKEDFVPWFMSDCLVSREKAALAYDIAVREKHQLDQLDYEEGYSLYIGIPFCPSVCSYCSFSSGSLSAWSKRVDDYVEALCKELTFIGKASKEKKLNTIYMGGGTPTTLTADQLEKVLTCVDENFSRDFLLEYTVEAGRPDSITREKFEVLLKHGITRISINPQSMQQKTLDAIGRYHSVESIKEAFHLAREMGFDNINMDLIAGLPGETLADMEDTLKQIAELAPDNLTVHSLAIKRAAKMGQEKKAKKAAGVKNVGSQAEDMDPFEVEKMVAAAFDQAKAMEMSPYYLYRQKNIAGNFENVGYAKVDK